MRGLAYAIAAIAAIGIMIGIASMPGNSSNAPDDAPASATPATVATASTAALSEPGTLTLSVPEMHCPFACYPKVKETLEGTTAVKKVELGPQKEEGVIDNRQVVVKYDAGFDVAAALKLLEKEGFSESKVVQ